MEAKIDQMRASYLSSLEAFDFSTIQEIVAELNSLEPNEKEIYSELYSEIGQGLFDAGLSVSSYDENEFTASIQKWKSRPKTVKAEIPEKILVDDFDQVYKAFHEKNYKSLTHLKGHFIFLVENESNSQTGIFILTDEKFHQHPLIDKIQAEYPLGYVLKYKIEEFNSQYKSNPQNFEGRYICLVALAPELSINTSVQGMIKGVLELFNSCRIIKNKSEVLSNTLDYVSSNINEDTYYEIENYCNIVFNNKAINFEEEKIIKRFFANNTPILDYKILKAGNSGSKVIEVQPIKNAGNTNRYVIKYGKKDAHRKIKKEQIAFKEHVEDYSDYSHAYIETEQYDAIRYKYASKDARTDSFSYSEILDDKISEKNKLELYDLVTVLDETFNSELFLNWNKSVSKQTKSVKEIYSDYINPASVLKALCIIENKSEEETMSLNLWQNYLAISEISLTYASMICHGDFHTENFFKDPNGVYLIDFGYTAVRHAIIDHTSLEASLKFKHIPRHIEMSELISIETSLLSPDSFEKKDLSFISRPCLNTIWCLINNIRSKSKTHLYSKTDFNEYFISLFMISFRQIQYADLNQRYAIASAEVISNHILSSI